MEEKERLIMPIIQRRLIQKWEIEIHQEKDKLESKKSGIAKAYKVLKPVDHKEARASLHREKLLINGELESLNQIIRALEELKWDL